MFPQGDNHTVAAVSSTTPVNGQRWNALKHGCYSEAILLPGDDAADFHQRRLALFLDYRPQTEDEAECVEVMAECRWLRRRYLPVQQRYDRQWLEPESDESGRVCEPVGHQRVHTSMDVVKHRQRLDRGWHKARAQLFLLQKQRRLGLVEGAVRLPPHCYMDAAGLVFGPVPPRVAAPLPVPFAGEAVSAHETPPEAVPVPARGSEDGGIGNREEQKESGGGNPAGEGTGERGALQAGADAGPTGPAPAQDRLPGSTAGQHGRGRLVGIMGTRRIFAPPAPREGLNPHPTLTRAQQNPHFPSLEGRV